MAVWNQLGADGLAITYSDHTREDAPGRRVFVCQGVGGPQDARDREISELLCAEFPRSAPWRRFEEWSGTSEGDIVATFIEWRV